MVAGNGGKGSTRVKMGVASEDGRSAQKLRMTDKNGIWRSQVLAAGGAKVRGQACHTVHDFLNEPSGCSDSRLYKIWTMCSTYFQYCRGARHCSRACVFRLSECLARVEFRSDFRQTAARLVLILLQQNSSYVTFI